MNRKQRRALPHGQPAAAAVAELFQQAAWHQDNGRLDDAARLYKRVVAREPGHGLAHNNLACVLLAQGRQHDASASFARAIAATPELLDDMASILGTLRAVLPAFAAATQRAATAWPRRIGFAEAFGDALGAVAADPLLLTVLTGGVISDLEAERLLTGLRADALASVTAPRAGVPLDLLGALAQQCFINEYVFASTAEEDGAAAALAQRIEAALRNTEPVAPAALIACAMHRPLHRLAGIEAALARPWPKPTRDVLAQQVGEPRREHELRATIPALTPVSDATSQRVRAQYEENPYPRWVHAAAPRSALPLETQLRNKFPAARVHPLDSAGPQVLIAGCGTGRHAIELTQTLPGAHVLAVDLSLASLAYARRKTPPALAPRIDYAQADILGLGALGRSFDVVSASGVLHHMADPVAGLRILTTLLRPHGLLHLGLYSETARRGVAAARAFIAARGYRAEADDIRRCRQELIAAQPDNPVIRWADFYSTSMCRDLLFHVEEHRFTIPRIKAVLAELGLAFLGFEIPPPQLAAARAIFAARGWSMTDLDRWDQAERETPDLFAGMYQFWVQKP